MTKKVIKVTNMTSAEMVKAVAAKSGVTQVQTKNVLDAMGEVCRECAAAGKQLNLFGFGKLKFAIVKGKPEREGIINPSTGETGTLPATPSYTKPVFRVSKSLADEIKESTKGRPFVQE